MEDKSVPPWGGPPPRPSNQELLGDIPVPKWEEGGSIWPVFVLLAFVVFAVIVAATDDTQSKKDAEIVALARQAASKGLPVESCPYYHERDKVLWVRAFAER